MTREIYSDKIFFGDDALVCKNKRNNKETEKMFAAVSGYTSHMVNSLENTKNLREVKTVVKTDKKKIITGPLQGDWKEYQKIDGKFYSVTCTETSYILDLSVNIFSVTHALIQRFKVTS